MDTWLEDRMRVKIQELKAEVGQLRVHLEAHRVMLEEMNEVIGKLIGQLRRSGHLRGRYADKSLSKRSMDPNPLATPTEINLPTARTVKR